VDALCAQFTRAGLTVLHLYDVNDQVVEFRLVPAPVSTR
jgi:hypothetical protein